MKPFSELRAQLSPESQARATERTAKLLTDDLSARLIALRDQLKRVPRFGRFGQWIDATDVDAVLAEFEVLLTALPPPPLDAPDLSQVTRVEVINETGRVYSHRPCTVQLSYQDAGSTLKVFVNWPQISAKEETEDDPRNPSSVSRS